MILAFAVRRACFEAKLETLANFFSVDIVLRECSEHLPRRDSNELTEEIVEAGEERERESSYAIVQVPNGTNEQRQTNSGTARYPRGGTG